MSLVVVTQRLGQQQDTSSRRGRFLRLRWPPSGEAPEPLPLFIVRRWFGQRLLKNECSVIDITAKRGRAEGASARTEQPSRRRRSSPFRAPAGRGGGGVSGGPGSGAESCGRPSRAWLDRALVRRSRAGGQLAAPVHRRRACQRRLLEQPWDCLRRRPASRRGRGGVPQGDRRSAKLPAGISELGQCDARSGPMAGGGGGVRGRGSTEAQLRGGAPRARDGVAGVGAGGRRGRQLSARDAARPLLRRGRAE